VHLGVTDAQRIPLQQQDGGTAAFAQRGELREEASLRQAAVMNPRIECGGLQSDHAPICKPWT